MISMVRYFGVVLGACGKEEAGVGGNEGEQNKRHSSPNVGRGGVRINARTLIGACSLRLARTI